MYTVYCDGVLMFDPRREDLKLTTANVETELNKTGSFSFTIHPSHPCYNMLRKMKSVITIYDDDELIFEGRVLNDDSGFFNVKNVDCEGELAYLLDSIVRPYDFNGTVTEYFTKLITEHNAQVDEAKRFVVGNVTVTDGDTSNDDNVIVRSDSEYKSTLSLLQEKLIDRLGGYVWIRHEETGKYIDYVSDFSLYNTSQTIEIGKNLLDVKKTVKGDSIASAIIPVGGGETNLTISTLPDGEIGRVDWNGEEATIYKLNDYVYCDKAVEEYGWIFKTETWRDTVTSAAHLQSVAVQKLVELMQLVSSVELTAADLADIQDVSPFRLARRIAVMSERHDLNTMFLIEKLSLNLLKPADNKLTIGKTVSSFTERTLGSAKEANRLIEQITATQTVLLEATEQTSSMVSQSANDILSQVSKDYYLKDEGQALVKSVNTQFAQTNREFELRFNDFALDLQGVAAGADAQFQNISKYIRFIDGNIVLGEEGNELTLKIQNERISFFQSGLEVAYFSNRKLFVTDGEYTNSLQLGNFAFIPRANGNLSFKKVT